MQLENGHPLRGLLGGLALQQNVHLPHPPRGFCRTETHTTAGMEHLLLVQKYSWRWARGSGREMQAKQQGVVSEASGRGKKRRPLYSLPVHTGYRAAYFILFIFLWQKQAQRGHTVTEWGFQQRTERIPLTSHLILELSLYPSLHIIIPCLWLSGHAGPPPDFSQALCLYPCPPRILSGLRIQFL